MYKTLDEFPNYKIYDDGRVYSNYLDCFLKTPPTKNGYLHLVLRDKEHRKRSVYLHRIVALAFLDNPKNLSQVNHIDGNKAHNSVSNLEWCDQFRNVQHSYDIGLRENNRKHMVELGKRGKRVSYTNLETSESLVFDRLVDACKALNLNYSYAKQCTRLGKVYKKVHLLKYL